MTHEVTGNRAATPAHQGTSAVWVELLDQVEATGTAYLVALAVALTSPATPAGGAARQELPATRAAWLNTVTALQAAAARLDVRRP